MKTEEWRITGTVQGVGFRWGSQRLARDLGLVGWVQNQADGSVLLQVQGEADRLEKFHQQLLAGPTAFARVEAIDRTPIATFDASDFSVR